MSGMGDGYVGTAQDAVRIRRLEKQREAERQKIHELKSKSASDNGQPGLLQFGSSTSEILETAFKKETIGLVTREQYVEKKENIKNKYEEEEKEKLQKLQQEEEELQLQKRKKRKIKGSSRLSFADEVEVGIEEEGGENKSTEATRLQCGRLGKDPTVETSFLPDSEREAEEQAERERLRKQWQTEQDKIRSNFAFLIFLYFSPFPVRSFERNFYRVFSGESLQITYSYWDGTGHRRVLQASNMLDLHLFSLHDFSFKIETIAFSIIFHILFISVQVKKGDKIGDFLKAVQQQLAPEFREVRTTSVENLLYVKEDLIIPHLFHFDVHEDVRTIADATIEKDESHAGKVVERHWYEKNKHIFPASRWEIYDPTKKWERYTIHGD
ncbi:hypothetical protein DVH24_019042 [Malus domestica]|uniref:FAM50A/XAP5 C-terminal domain-containing protein n=1 Tax=Malus domestica TaxID=3750 RepID=A0A498I1N3_MALDO|nr:hypothetical protein DVH24_019042 [Malus domestica]